MAEDSGLKSESLTLKGFPQKRRGPPSDPSQKPKLSKYNLADNGLRAGDRSPVLLLRQGYGACTLLVGAIHIFCSMSIVLNLVEDTIQIS